MRHKWCSLHLLASSNGRLKRNLSTVSSGPLNMGQCPKYGSLQSCFLLKYRVLTCSLFKSDVKYHSNSECLAISPPFRFISLVNVFPCHISITFADVLQQTINHENTGPAQTSKEPRVPDGYKTATNLTCKLENVGRSKFRRMNNP